MSDGSSPEQPIFREGKIAQPWVDQRRELAFHTASAYFDRLNPTQTQAWFVELFQAPGRKDARRPFTKSNVQSLICVNAESTSATEIAGQPITRPLFIFQDFQELTYFYQSIHPTAAVPGAVWLFGNNFPKSVIEKTGLIVGKPDKAALGHELRHTIDPNAETRTDYNQILGELFAYYNDTVLGRTQPSERGNSWQSLEKLISGQGYWQDYSETTPTRYPYPAYQTLCHTIIENAKKLQAKYGDLETQRKIVQCKTNIQLLRLT